MSVLVLNGSTNTGRTVLEIIQDVATKIGSQQPTAVFGSSDRTAVELREALIEAADKIVRAHDWGELKILLQHNGNGETVDYDLPSDFLRMPKNAEIWSTRWQHPLLHISAEDWLHLEVREFDTIVGSWTRLGSKIRYTPALAQDEAAKFWYVSKHYAESSEGTFQERFTEDVDKFRLDDRVLELMTVWVWRQQKGLDYAEDLQTAELALSRAISDDKGARILTQRTRRNHRTRVAYPWKITP